MTKLRPSPNGEPLEELPIYDPELERRKLQAYREQKGAGNRFPVLAPPGRVAYDPDQDGDTARIGHWNNEQLPYIG